MASREAVQRRTWDLLWGPLAEAEAGFCPERQPGGGLDRDACVEAMGLVLGDVVGLQPLKRCVDLLGDLGRRESLVTVAHVALHLGREDVGIPGVASEDLAPRRVGGAATVDAGGVKEVNARVKCASAQARVWSAWTPPV